MKSLVFLCWLVAATCADDLHPTWDEVMQEEFHVFKLKFGKSYRSDAEEKCRLQNFVRTYQYVTWHNALYAQALTSFTMNIIDDADLSEEEMYKRKATKKTL